MSAEVAWETAAWVLGLVVLWPACGVLAWLIAVRRVYPWNWRVLLGPWQYIRWLDRRHR